MIPFCLFNNTIFTYIFLHTIYEQTNFSKSLFWTMTTHGETNTKQNERFFLELWYVMSI